MSPAANMIDQGVFFKELSDLAEERKCVDFDVIRQVFIGGVSEVAQENSCSKELTVIYTQQISSINGSACFCHKLEIYLMGPDWIFLHCWESTPSPSPEDDDSQ